MAQSDHSARSLVVSSPSTGGTQWHRALPGVRDHLRALRRPSDRSESGYWATEELEDRLRYRRKACGNQQEGGQDRLGLLGNMEPLLVGSGWVQVVTATLPQIAISALHREFIKVIVEDLSSLRGGSIDGIVELDILNIPGPTIDYLSKKLIIGRGKARNNVVSLRNASAACYCTSKGFKARTYN